MTHSLRALALAPALALLAVVAPSCEGAVDFSGVYLEEFGAGGVDEARDAALRLTIYEYVDEVGGFVEYYEFGGLNTRRTPYVTPTACAYFGPVRSSDDIVRFEAIGVDGASTLRLELEGISRNDVRGFIDLPGGTVDEAIASSDTYELMFIDDELRTPARQCPEDARLLGVTP